MREEDGLSLWKSYDLQHRVSFLYGSRNIVIDCKRDLVRQTCEAHEMQILSGVVSKDHVHILVSAPRIWYRVRP